MGSHGGWPTEVGQDQICFLEGTPGDWIVGGETGGQEVLVGPGGREGEEGNGVTAQDLPLTQVYPSRYS